MTKPKARVAVTDELIDAARSRARPFQVDDRRAVRVVYEKKPDLVTLYLVDGVRISIPRRSLEGLRDASARQLGKVEILGRGTGIHWPLLDVDHYVPGLLNHIFGTSRWMAELGRRGGSATSGRKTAAARANGKKGGRPKQHVA
jgi:Protein of unknown function (DUF2442)